MKNKRQFNKSNASTHINSNVVFSHDFNAKSEDDFVEKDRNINTNLKIDRQNIGIIKDSNIKNIYLKTFVNEAKNFNNILEDNNKKIDLLLMNNTLNNEKSHKSNKTNNSKNSFINLPSKLDLIKKQKLIELENNVINVKKWNSNYINSIKIKIRQENENRLVNEKELLESSFINDSKKLKSNENFENGENNFSSIKKSQNIINSIKKERSISSLNEIKQKIINNYSTLDTLEDYYFPYNKKKDQKRLSELANILRGSNTKQNFYKNDKISKVNFLYDTYKVPTFNTEYSKLSKSNNNEKQDNVSFKQKLEKFQIPNYINTNTWTKINLMKIEKELLKINKKEELKVESTPLNSMEMHMKIMKSYLNKGNQDEDYVKYFVYQRKHDVYFVKDRCYDEVLNIL